jgi:hypothetical protein
MKIYFIVLLVCLSYVVSAQQKESPQEQRTSITILPAEIPHFLDSVKTVIINDTSRYDAKQLYQEDGVTRNKAGYSKLFVIDNKYSYRLDVINGAKVMEFIKEFFVPESIETIVDFIGSGAAAIYGKRADLGAVYIQMKKGVKYNPRVGGINPNARPGNL